MGKPRKVIKLIGCLVIGLMASLMLACPIPNTDGSTQTAQELADSLDASSTSGASGYCFVYQSGDSPSAITANFTLQSKVGSEVAVSWTEVSDIANVVSLSGVTVTINTPAVDKTVILEASVSAGGETVTKDFTFTVKGNPNGTINGNVQFKSDDSAAANYNVWVNADQVKIGADVSNNATTPAHQVLSNASGNYSMTILAGSYYLYIDGTTADPIFNFIMSCNITSGGTTLASATSGLAITDLPVSLSRGETKTIDFKISGY